MAHEHDALATPDQGPRAEEATPTRTPPRRRGEPGLEVRGSKRGVPEYYLNGQRIDRARGRWLWWN